MGTRPQWIADKVKRGQLGEAETLARNLPEHVPAYDWEPLTALVSRLDAMDAPATQALYSLLDAAIARGPKRIPMRGPGVRMPVPD
jgi:hypothetical protein